MIDHFRFCQPSVLIISVVLCAVQLLFVRCRVMTDDPLLKDIAVLVIGIAIGLFHFSVLAVRVGHLRHPAESIIGIFPQNMVRTAFCEAVVVLHLGHPAEIIIDIFPKRLSQKPAFGGNGRQIVVIVIGIRQSGDAVLSESIVYAGHLSFRVIGIGNLLLRDLFLGRKFPSVPLCHAGQTVLRIIGVYRSPVQCPGSVFDFVITHPGYIAVDIVGVGGLQSLRLCSVHRLVILCFRHPVVGVILVGNRISPGFLFLAEPTFLVIGIEALNRLIFSVLFVMVGDFQFLSFFVGHCLTEVFFGIRRLHAGPQFPVHIDLFGIKGRFSAFRHRHQVQFSFGVIPIFCGIPHRIRIGSFFSAAIIGCGGYNRILCNPPCSVLKGWLLYGSQDISVFVRHLQGQKTVFRVCLFPRLVGSQFRSIPIVQGIGVEPI